MGGCESRADLDTAFITMRTRFLTLDRDSEQRWKQSTEMARPEVRAGRIVRVSRGPNPPSTGGLTAKI